MVTANQEAMRTTINARLQAARQELRAAGVDLALVDFIGVEFTRAGVRLTVPRSAVAQLTAAFGELPAYIEIVEEN